MNTMSSLTRKLYIRLCESGRLCFSSKPQRFEIREVPSAHGPDPGVEPQVQRNDPNEDNGGLFRIFLGNRKTKHVEVMKFLQSNIDFSPEVVNLWFKRRIRNRQITDQAFKQERHDTLGADLAAAHFLLHRGCAVQFEGKPWFRKEDLKEIELPDLYQEGWILRAIDVSYYDLHYEGFVNLRNLRGVKVLIAQHSPHLDDWCLDLLTSELPNLQTLVLTGCKNVTERGLVTITRLRKLKSLILKDIPASKTSAFRLTCLMLEDEIPDLLIEGVELDPEVAEAAMKETSNLDINEDPTSKLNKYT